MPCQRLAHSWALAHPAEARVMPPLSRMARIAAAIAAERGQARPTSTRRLYGMAGLCGLVTYTLLTHAVWFAPAYSSIRTRVSVKVVATAASRWAVLSLNTRPVTTTLSSSSRLPAGSVPGEQSQPDIAAIGRAAATEHAQLVTDATGSSGGAAAAADVKPAMDAMRSFKRRAAAAQARHSSNTEGTGSRAALEVQAQPAIDAVDSSRVGGPTAQAQPLVSTVGSSSGEAAASAEAEAKQAAPSVRLELQPAGASSGARPQLAPQELLALTLAEPKLPLGRSPCDALLQVPKVALLFLTIHTLPHERLWARWLSHAVGLLPVEAVAQYATGARASSRKGARQEEERGALGLLLRDRERLSEVAEACGGLVANSSMPLRDRQLLFTVYVHTSPGTPPYDAASVFAGAVIPRLIRTSRHNHDVMEAERLLLAEALRDPLNHRFLLLSDTTLPIYNAATLYSQLMAEKLSRLDACTIDWGLNGNRDRWNENMVTQTFRPEHWRKSSQFFSVTRKHAQLMVNDVEINNAFAKHCRILDVHPITHTESWCSSNEHYPAIILAVYGLQAETTCSALGTTFVDWSIFDYDGHPRSYMANETTPDLVQGARTTWPNCSREQTEAVVQAAALQYVNVTDLAVQVASAAVSLSTPPPFPALNGNCSLFIRKFPAETAAVALEVFHDFTE